MSHQVISSALVGIDAVPISVQIDSSPGLHSFTIVGLGDKSVQESIDRIESAVKQCGFVPPRAKNRRFIVNLSPADLKKEGPGYDLPIAIAYLIETRQIKQPPDSIVFIGELGLDGSLTHTNGILAATLMARDSKATGIIVPLCNADEATMVPAVTILGANSLSEVVSHLTGDNLLSPLSPSAGANLSPHGDNSLAFIRGQETAKRALIVAAAGGHNVLMTGAPGSGKTLLARSLVGILPPLTTNEALEVAKIRSAAGILRGPMCALERPFRAPHHTSSPVSVIGGGSLIRPGQISLAHRGVLFLDEMPEFARNVLEALRQPLEDGSVSVSRASGTLTLPAKFMLVGAMNPCPCGNSGDPTAICSCSQSSISKYAKKISGPLLDRMDIQLRVSREKIGATPPMNEAQLRHTRTIIAQARELQRTRFAGTSLITNSEIDHKNVAAYCILEAGADRLLREIANRKNLSLRAYHKTQKVARTIADLEGSERIGEAHVAEALSLRIGYAQNGF